MREPARFGISEDNIANQEPEPHNEALNLSLENGLRYLLKGTTWLETKINNAIDLLKIRQRTG